MQQDLEWYQKWPVIIIAFFFCWPAGLIMLFSRLKNDRSAAIGGGRVFKIIGWALTVLFGIGTLANLTNGNIGPAVMCGIFLAGGLALLKKGRDLISQSERTRRYIELVVNQQHTSIDNIASLTQRTDILNVQSEIQTIIDGGFLPGFRLNPSTRMIERPQKAAPAAAAGAAPAVMVSFTCHTCGANNEGFPGSDGVVRCEFCDTAKKG